MKVTIGQQELEMGSKYLTELRSSNDIAENTDALRSRLSEDGYLLIRGLHDREQVLRTRSAALRQLADKGLLAPGSDPEQGVIGPDNKSSSFDVPEMYDIVNAPSLLSFFDRLLGGKSMTYDYKWTRGVPKGGFTGAHYDIVYMGRGSKNVYTVWTPIGDISYELGGLALCLGSQHFEKIRNTYGQMDVDRDNVTGWFSNDPCEIVDRFGGQWATTEFRAGDALIFGMYMMHGSLTNTTNTYRLSCDTRYQLADEPVDERWIGKKPKGHYAWTKGTTVDMADARAKWGV